MSAFQMELYVRMQQIKRHWPKLAFATAVIIFGTSIVLALSQASRNSGTNLVDEVEAESSVSEVAIDSIAVDVSGAVVHPGVYYLSRTARVEQAISKAGGFADTADSNYVAKQMNLAAKIADGQKIYVAHKGEDKSNIPPQLTTQSVSGSASTAGKINLNTASSKELEALPGIGAVTAKKIIDNRPYQTVQELQSKKVLSASVYTKVLDSIAVQ